MISDLRSRIATCDGRQPGPEAIESLKGQIDEDVKLIHSINDLRTYSKKSVETIRKEFYRATKVNLSCYIRQVRVEKMKKLLLESERACKDICLEVGCRDDSGAKLFKKITGMTMEEFRQRHRNGNGGGGTVAR